MMAFEEYVTDNLFALVKTEHHFFNLFHFKAPFGRELPDVGFGVGITATGLQYKPGINRMFRQEKKRSVRCQTFFDHLENGLQISHVGKNIR